MLKIKVEYMCKNNIIQNMPKRNRKVDDEPPKTAIPKNWDLRTIMLPSVPIAVFNR